MKTVFKSLICLALLAGPAGAQVGVRTFPTPQQIPGKPIETRAPELASDTPAFPGQTRAPYRATKPYSVAVITDKLQQPWSLAFLPDGRMLVTEKPGRMRIVDAAGTISAPIAGVPAVNFQGQAGLLDLALDPNFRRNRRIFFAYSEQVGTDQSNIVVGRATLNAAATELLEAKVIFRAKPALSKDYMPNEGGRLLFGPDGFLYVTIGDRSKSPPWDMAQKLDTDLGKIIRLTVDGGAAPGNPFAKTPGALPEIWSYGHRSEEAVTFDSRGRFWEIEHGPRGGDELNLIQPGKNYGWPIIAHGIDYPGDKINNGLTQKAGLEQPRYYWDPVIAPSGMVVYQANLFPDWKGNILVGALRGKSLVRLTLKDDKVVDEEPLLVEVGGRIRDVRVGPEGAVYVLSEEGKLLKMTPR